jgi:hypothetical protein
MDAQMNMPMFGAAFIMQLQQLRPTQPYQVTKLNGKVKKDKYVYEATGKFKTLKDGSQKPIMRLNNKSVEVDAGYLVKFPNGHAIRVADDAELQRLGFHLEPGLISMETGDILIPNYEKLLSQIENLSLLGGGYMPSGVVEQKSEPTLVNLAEGNTKKGGK